MIIKLNLKTWILVNEGKERNKNNFLEFLDFFYNQKNSKKSIHVWQLK